MIYLASPYSHPDRSVRVARFEAACRAAATMMDAGQHVFSPIAHTHPIHEAGGLPGDWAFWEPYDRWFISRCDKVVVLRLPGWTESKGVAAEIRIACDLGKPVEYVNPTE